MKHLIVFFRHTNDLDHITPVIFKWLSEASGSVHAVYLSGPELLEDFRTLFLSRLAGFTYSTAKNYCSPADLEKMSTRQLSVSDIIASSSFAQRMATILLAQQEQSLFVFDWIMTTSGHHYDFFKNIMPHIRNAERHVIMLPHGDSPHQNRMIRVSNLSYPSTDIYAPGALTDYVVVPNSTCAMRYHKHLPANRIGVLGSPRFCREWLTELDAFAPSFHIEQAEKKCKIALFLRNSAYPLFWEEIYWSILLITQFTDVHLTVVPHSRKLKTNILTELYPDIKEAHDNLTYVEEDIYAGAIVRWADVIIDIGTSMAFEAVVRGKAIICPEYLHATRTITSTYFLKSVATCRDDLYDMIASLQEDSRHRWHSSNEAEIFTQEMVHVPDHHVLKRYVDFLENFSEKFLLPNTQRVSPLIHKAPGTDTHWSLTDNSTVLSRSSSQHGRALAIQNKKITDREQIITEIITAHIRVRWMQLLQYEQIRTVFFFGEKNQVRRLLDIVKGTKGPAILGFHSSDAEQNNSLNDIPFISIKQMKETPFDAIVLATEIHSQSLHSHCIRLFPVGTTIANLCEITHTPHYLRRRRDSYLTDENHFMAWEAALALLEFSPTESDLMTCYKIGLELQQRNFLEKARIAYEKISSCAEVKPELAAWAFFKHGEILLDKEQPESARKYFSRALMRNPKHSKAAILLTPANRPLRVTIAETVNDKVGENDNCIEVIMNITDPELWEYYFSRRKPNHVRLRIDKDGTWQKLTIVAELLWRHIGPSGCAEIIFSSEPLNASLNEAEEIFRSAGFHPEHNEPQILILLAKK